MTELVIGGTGSMRVPDSGSQSQAGCDSGTTTTLLSESTLQNKRL